MKRLGFISLLLAAATTPAWGYRYYIRPAAPAPQPHVQQPTPTVVDPALAAKQAQAALAAEQNQWSNHVAMTRAVVAAENAKPKEDPAKVDQRVVEFLQYRVDHGSAEARYDLAQRYLSGKGVEKSDEKARQLLKEAADQGHADSAKLLKTLKGPSAESTTPPPTASPAPAPTTPPATQASETAKAQ